MGDKVAAAIPVTVADSEASIAAGHGGIWVLTDQKGVLWCVEEHELGDEETA